MGRSVALIGFMGSGKSTVGRVLSRRLGVRFIDLDELIEQRESLSVPALFSERGEEGFRAAEREALEVCLSDSTDMVLACGGGTPCQPGLLESLLGWGEVVFLDVPYKVLEKRGLSGRPLWGEGAAQLYKDRLKIYQRAPIHLDGTLPPEVLVEAAVRSLELRG